MAHARGNPSQHVPVPIEADLSALSEYDRDTLQLLLLAARLMNGVFLAQTQQDFAKTGNKFMPGRGTEMYPPDMSKEEFDMFLRRNPDKRLALMDPFTAVKRAGDGFEAVPLTELYAPEFSQASDLLKKAGERMQQPRMKEFLLARAEAFRTNEYRESDIAWISANDSVFELIIGPYESYNDKLYGVKRTVEAVVGIVQAEETREAGVFIEQIGRFDSWLGERFGYKARTTLTPMVVIDVVLYAGESLYDFVPMACNLPNETDIHMEFGSKKVFMRNTMRAKLETITIPIAQRVLDADLAKRIDPATMLLFVIGHEASHGLSFHFSGEDFAELHSGLEEGKADVFGLLFLYFLEQQGVIPAGTAENATIAHLTDGLRQIRFGIDEAHAIGTLIQYNWLMGHDALAIVGNTLRFHPERFEQSLRGLGDVLYGLSQTKNIGTAELFKAKWGQVSDEVRAITEGLTDIPVDIDPQFSV